VSYLVDTNVISELRKGPRCDESVAAWWSGIVETDVFLSVLTIGEIRKGIENVRRRDMPSAVALEKWLARLLRDHASRILPIDHEIVEEWGRLNVPDPLPVIDGLLAATAHVHDLTLVTRNVADVARTGVTALNPWRVLPR
jgi:predicted nucleic acid-binding protein